MSYWRKSFLHIPVMIFLFSNMAFGQQEEGYYRYPTIQGDMIAFVAEDDLWTVPASGGNATRLTTSLSTVAYPRFSPDGDWLAFTGAEEGPMEVFVISSKGGRLKRLTFLGSRATTLSWREDRILFSSNYGQPNRQPGWLFSIEIDGSGLERLPLGPADRYDASGDTVVLGRKMRRFAGWKRYRGGTAGEIYIDAKGMGDFSKLIDLESNLFDPMILGGRVYFLSDHEGIGNLYSCAFDGSDLRRHTDHQDYYARNASTDGSRIVYHSGANLYLYDPSQERSTKVDFSFPGARAQTHRRFESASEFLEDYAPSPDGARIALTSRGKSFAMGCWDGPVYEQSAVDGVRYRLARFIDEATRMIVASDAGGEDHLEIVHVDNSEPPKVVPVEDLGRPMEIKISPATEEAAVVNHRNELVFVDLKNHTSHVIDQDKYHPIRGFDWSSDGKWIAYSVSINPRQSIIKVFDVETLEIHPITEPVRWDEQPTFDPEGKYLYFLSARVYNPVYESLQFDLGFPCGMRPYAVALRKDIPSPFEPVTKGFGGKEKKEEKKDEENKKGSEESDDSKKEKKKEKLKIDFEGIEDRVVAFPVKEGLYREIAATKGRVFYTVESPEGALGSSIFQASPPGKKTLKLYKLEKREEKDLTSGVSGFKISRNGSALALRAGKRLRVVAADSDEISEKDETNRESGWIDLGRPKLSIDPTHEWRQMLGEAWRLQRDYFWTEDLSKVDWAGVLEKYLPLVGRVSSRHEFADLVWEMQGELGTSHAYEMRGDYRDSPNYKQGFLGADFVYDEAQGAWKIDRIPTGDSWDPKFASPMRQPGVPISEGMFLLAINGRDLSMEDSPHEILVNTAGQKVALKVSQGNGASPKTFTVKTLGSETNLRYRDWVERNRDYVHEKTGGKVGYFHVPDMGAFGYSEFHRGFLPEVDHEGLIVDIRFNGGGHVSQLLLDKLARTRIGYSVTRWMGVEPYPSESPRGPMVCLINEYAGSDADIFSNGFRTMDLGPLIGRRTWGGVVGIWPRNSLVDGTLTTQPEFSYWFKGVGWGIENYGVDPDIVVDISPSDYAANRDPQLDRGIEEVLKRIESNPPTEPDFSVRPDLSVH